MTPLLIRRLPDGRSVSSLLLDHWNFFRHLDSVVFYIVGAPTGTGNFENPSVLESVQSRIERLRNKSFSSTLRPLRQNERAGGDALPPK